ncbi:hypothetical protein D3C80_2009030 [compost metagenome]
MITVQGIILRPCGIASPTLISVKYRFCRIVEYCVSNCALICEIVVVIHSFYIEIEFQCVVKERRICIDCQCGSFKVVGFQCSVGIVIT